MSNRDSFKSKFSKVNIFKKKREGSFFPYQHTIKNEHVEKVLMELQIYPVGFVPTTPDTCFVHSLRGQVPDGVLQKIKRDVRSEFVSLTTIKKVAKITNCVFTSSWREIKRKPLNSVTGKRW